MTREGSQQQKFRNWRRDSSISARDQCIAILNTITSVHKQSTASHFLLLTSTSHPERSVRLESRTSTGVLSETSPRLEVNGKQLAKQYGRHHLGRFVIFHPSPGAWFSPASVYTLLFSSTTPSPRHLLIHCRPPVQKQCIRPFTTSPTTGSRQRQVSYRRTSRYNAFHIKRTTSGNV